MTDFERQFQRVILASGSSRRRELLSREYPRLRYEIVVPRETAECGICSGEGPAGLVSRYAWQKACDVAEQLGLVDLPATGDAWQAALRPSAPATSHLLVACDTVVECQGFILGKPRDIDHARQMLSSLSGREHRVYSGLCVWPLPLDVNGRLQMGKPDLRIDVTVLKMDTLSDEQLSSYLAGGEWEGKAGSFGYQDGLDWVHVIQGSESNVVGLPLELLRKMLGEFSNQS